MQLKATRLTAIASAVKRAFNIRSLFAGAVPGVWYDPSDYTTLFQDSAGTTPVTAVEQPVGLMLDKSQGLVLGSELAPSTIPSVSGAGWITNGTSITATNSTASGTIALTASTSSTKFYQVTFTASGLSGATSYMVFSSGVAAVTKRINTAKSYSFIVPGQGTAAFEIAPYEGTAFSVTISAITVKELAGNHAFQATSASRPVLSARYNQFISTENLSVNWNTLAQGSGAAPVRTPNAGVDPLGGNNATRLQFSRTGTTAVDRSVVWQSISTASTQTNYPTTIWLKSYSGATQKIALMPNFGNGAPVEVTVTSAWQAFVVQANTLTGTSARLDIGLGYVTSTETSADVLAWGASLVPANQSTLPYQRVNTSTDYATTGFLPYLRFDGVDDSLSTNSISFTATDKMSVFAGVRKLSDAAQGVVAELSIGGQNGVFQVTAPLSASPSYQFFNRGTVNAFANVNTGYASPITNVFTGLGDISGDLSALRLNGTQVAQSTADQGTGNYGNYPLYIGRRNNASLPFNGQLYSMVIVGKAVTAGELSSTETYVNQKTGAY